MTVQRESRPLQAIKELVIRGSADVFVKRGEPLMTVIAEKPVDVITEIRGGVLTISQKPTVMAGVGRGGTALLHNSTSGQASPDPRRSYATATVWGVPSSVN